MKVGDRNSEGEKRGCRCALVMVVDQGKEQRMAPDIRRSGDGNKRLDCTALLNVSGRSRFGDSGKEGKVEDAVECWTMVDAEEVESRHCQSALQR